MICPVCGASNAEVLAFCKKCGASLNKGEPRAEADPGPAVERRDPQAPVPSPTSTENKQIVYAGFGWRLLAAFIDSLLLQAVSFVTLLTVGFGLAMAAGRDLDPTTIRIIMGVFSIGLLVVIGWLYEAYMVSSSYQATLGKMAVGIIVTDAAGQRVSFWRATARLLGKHLSTIPLCVGYLIQPFTEKRQALHDMMAGCLVLRKVPR